MPANPGSAGTAALLEAAAPSPHLASPARRPACSGRLLTSSTSHLLIALSVDDDGVVHAAPEPRWPSVDEERAAMRLQAATRGFLRRRPSNSS